MSNHISNPFDSPADALAHYGVLGMKWGVRKSKTKTGLSRPRGALIDRNNRAVRGLKKQKKGRDPITKLAITLHGEEQVQKNLDKSIRYLTSQNTRLRNEGKLFLSDNLDLWANTVFSPESLVISLRPEKSKATT